MGSISGWGRSPGGGQGNPLRYSCLGNPMDRGAWRVTVHRTRKSQTRLKWLSTHAVSTVAVPSLHPSIDGGGFSFLHARSSLGSLECLIKAILTSVRWYLIVVLIWISLIFSKIDISCLFLKGMSKTSCNWLLNILISVLINAPRTFFESGCCLVTTPWAFWILSAHQHSFRHCRYGKWPQGGSIFHVSPLPFLLSVQFHFDCILEQSWCPVLCLYKVYRNLIQPRINAYLFFSRFLFPYTADPKK